MKLLALLLAVVLVGCIKPPPPRAPGELGAAVPDPAKWKACEKVRSRQNVLSTIGGGLGLSAGVGGLAGDRAVGNTGQVVLGISGVGLAVVGSILSAFGGFASNEYSRDQCSSVTPP